MTEVGRNASRRVDRVDVDGVGRFFVKRFAGPRASVHAQRERLRHEAVAARGLAVAPLLPPVDEDALVLCALQGCALDHVQGSADPRELAAAVGEELARWHARGVAHRQLFAWHVWRGDDGGLTLLDLADCRLARPIRFAHRVRDLASLFATSSAAGLSRAARVRLLRAYGLSRRERVSFWRAIERAERRCRRRFRFPRTWQGREARRDGDRLLVHDSVRECVDRRGGPWPVSRWIRPADAVCVRERDERTNLRLEAEPGARWFGKVYARPGPGPRLAAMNEFGRHRQLERLGLRVPRVLLVARDRSGASALWTEGVRPGQSLRDTVHRWTAEGRPVPLELVRGLAVDVARLHRAGCVHGDLYLDHWLREDTAEGPRWVLIDLARVGEPRWTFARRRIKDLAAVEYSARTAGVPRTVRLRAFRWYLGGLRDLSLRGRSLHGLDRDALRRLRRARRLWRAVLRRADWIEARERRHGRWPVPLPGVESCTSA